MALLRFDNNDAEAVGIARLIERLVREDEIPPTDILVLLRGDRHGHFSGPIKEALQPLGIPVSDADVVGRALEEAGNRQSLELLRLLVEPDDSLAWAALLKLTNGIGDAFVSHIYDAARAGRVSFGTAFNRENERRFEGAPGGGRALALAVRVQTWLDAQEVPHLRLRSEPTR